MAASAPSVPQHRFLNCEMEIECPANWFELTETQQAGVKHCSTCQKNVHLCITQEELVDFAHKGECIAFFADPDLPTRFQLSRERVESNRKNHEYQIERITLGLTRNGGRGKQVSFLDVLDQEKRKLD